MSGFFAVLNRDRSPVDPSIAHQLLSRIQHQGTDALEVWSEGSTALGAAVFRTTNDTRDEQQPCQIGDAVIVADAYLVNRSELVEQISRNLSIPVDRLSSAPDSELILHAYHAWGENCPGYLSGVFAFAIWDEHRQRLFAAIDQTGQSLIYYTFTNNLFILSTEMSTLRLHPSIDFIVNESAIADHLLFGTHLWHDKTRTPFGNIQRLAPAQALGVGTAAQQNDASSEPKTWFYWNVPIDEPMLLYPKIDDYIQHLQELLLSVVKSYIRADKIGIMLSGGMDSTSLAVAARAVQQRGGASFELSSINQFFQHLHGEKEAYYAWLTALKLNIPVAFFECDPYPMTDPLPVVAEMGVLYQPGLYEAFNQAALQCGRVMLAGHGSDELFSITPIMNVLRKMPPRDAYRLLRTVWKITGKRPALGLQRYAIEYLSKLKTGNKARQPEIPFDYPIWLNPDFEAKLNLKEVWKAHWEYEAEDIHPTQPIAYRYLTSARWSRNVELVNPLRFTPPKIYSPFLDLRLIRFALSLPPQLSLQSKYLLRQAMRDSLPAEILYRPKEPLGYLLTSLLRLPTSAWVDTWKPVLEMNQYIQRDRIPKIVGWNIDPSSQVQNIRPFTVNRWLQAVRPES